MIFFCFFLFALFRLRVGFYISYLRDDSLKVKKQFLPEANSTLGAWVNDGLILLAGGLGKLGLWPEPPGIKKNYCYVNVLTTLFLLQEKELLSKVCPVLTIGPSVPSMYLDQRIKSDTDYDLNLFDSKDSSFCTSWLDTRPQGSVVYVAFGSMAKLNSVQMEELASAISNFSFLWVVRESEEATMPSGFLETVDKDKSLVLKWSPQLEVLSNKAIGCFLTHCGWNSTMEALTFGVPMVAMPQWTDQPMNAKYIQDVWKAGVRVKMDEESGIVKREEIDFSIKEVMEGEKSKEMKRTRKNGETWLSSHSAKEGLQMLTLIHL